jgi:SAM-dependent methyltransferase
MIAQARVKLADIPHAHPRHASGSDLADFSNETFDFVYSYAVFQHIPSAAVVFNYFREIIRVLNPGGFARLQINGLPKSAKEYTTWSGVRISGQEIHSFTRERGIDLLALTGDGTQYMWTTWRKPAACFIRRVVNAATGESAVPAQGMLSDAALWVEGLPHACDLTSLEVFIDGVRGAGCYLGPEANGLSQVNVYIPEGIRTGLLPVRLEWHGRRLCPDATLRVIPPGPSVPRLVSVSDGVNLLSYQRVDCGWMKASIEDVQPGEEFAVNIDSKPVRKVEVFQTDPRARRYEVNFELPPEISPGGHVLELRIGNRLLTRMGIEVVR